jgi:hypothetical protein
MLWGRRYVCPFFCVGAGRQETGFLGEVNYERGTNDANEIGEL